MNTVKNCKEMFQKYEVINALEWMFGYTTTQAKKLYAKTSAEYHNEAVLGFRKNAKRTFYCD